MAIFQQGAFVLDPTETPQSIAKKRAMIQQMTMPYGKASNIGEGIAQLFNGISTGSQLRQLDKAEKAGEASGATARQNLYSMLMGGNSAPLLPGKFPDAPAAPQSSVSSPHEAIAAMLKGEPVQGTLANGRAIDRASMAGYSGDVRQTTPNYAGGGMAGKIAETAQALGIDPIDLATTISYETAGTFDPTKKGPTTQHGQHRGLIQFGEPQAKQHGVDWNNPVDSQLGANGAVASYLRNAGVKPGMGMLDLYSAVNAGRVGRYNASDANNGGAPGTVADKVNTQMSGHRAKAQKLMAALMGGETTQIASAPNAYSMEANTGNRMPLADQGMQANTGNKMPLADQGIQVASLDPSVGMASYAPSQPQTMYVGQVNPNGTIGTAAQAVNGMAQGGLAQPQQPSPAPQPQQVAQAAPQSPQQPAMAIQDAGTPFERMAPQQQGGMNLEMLLQQAQNPWLDDQSKAFVNGLIQQEMQKRDPAYQQKQQMDQIGLQKAQIELERLKSGTPADPLEAQYKQMQIKKMEAEIAKAGQPDASSQPSSIQEYEYFTKLDPEQQKRYLAVKRSQQTVDLGTGYGVLDPTNPGQIGAQIPKDIEGKVLAEAAAKDKGENLALLNSMKAKMPGLETVVKELNDIGKEATYTLSGQIFNEGRKQLGMAPSDGAVARTKYAAVVANQVLPLLRDTFGAQFTAAEGDRLLATLGDPDVSPAEKEAVLQSFIEQKKRDIEGLAVQTGQQSAPNPAQAAPSGNLKSKYGLE